MSCKLVEFNNNDGYVNSEFWKLSDMAKKELLSELNLKETHNYRKDLISFDTIKPKEMFYNSRENEAIGTLISLLTNENYRKIQERLGGKGMRKGFACLFSGEPGTGKTETAYQIAPFCCLTRPMRLLAREKNLRQETGPLIKQITPFKTSSWKKWKPFAASLLPLQI